MSTERDGGKLFRQSKYRMKMVVTEQLPKGKAVMMVSYHGIPMGEVRGVLYEQKTK